MKYSIGMKILAFILAVVSLTAMVASGIGIVVLLDQGLYTQEYDQWVDEFYQVRTVAIAQAVAESYAARNLSGMSEQELKHLGWGNHHWDLSEMWGIDHDGWAYTICKPSGLPLEMVHPMDTDDLTAAVHRVKVQYPVRVWEMSAEWDQIVEYNAEDGMNETILVQLKDSPEYEVMVWMTPGCLKSFSGIALDFYAVLTQFRYILIGVAVVSLLLTVVCLVYLCIAAGRSSKLAGVKPGGLNRLPLDIYAAALCAALLFLYLCMKEVVEELLFYKTSFFLLGWILAGGIALAAALCVIAGIFALAAQWKMGDHYVWKHSLIGWSCRKLWAAARFCWKGLCKLYDLLPLISKYLLIAFAMAVVPVFCLFMCIVSHNLGRAFWVLALVVTAMADVAMICYGAFAYGTVLKGAKSMAEGNLRSSIDTRHLRGSYKTCADDLNALADVAVEAAKKQMRSERMKAELVTNVSHDIKTPLTSVINYIDLLQKAENEEQSKQYLEVLDRQAQKLKKLIDDLMEMSKATTGDMAVDIGAMDAVEAMTQALGEFSDKLEQEDLTVVFRKPETPVYIQADGRLVWRVLSNLMSNVVKYALPGTRVYAQVQQQDSQVLMTLKNISREELNVSAEELTERFVRGDASRNTEGSGLGLNIAKCLMDLQKGNLELTVDGDLFKVSLTFPAQK